jgi:hypothetical protein
MNEKQTARCSKLLPPEYQSQFTVLAQVMEKASIWWALALGPVVWAFRNKHYVIGYQDRDRTLYLFRVPMGFLGLRQATSTETFTAEQLQELDYRQHLLTGSFTFRKPDGTTINLFVPKPSTKNAKAIYEAVRTGSTRQ